MFQSFLQLSVAGLYTTIGWLRGKKFTGFYVFFSSFYRIVLVHCVVLKLYCISHLHDYFSVFLLIPLATVKSFKLPCCQVLLSISTADWCVLLVIRKLINLFYLLISLRLLVINALKHDSFIGSILRRAASGLCHCQCQCVNNLHSASPCSN